MLMEKWIPTMLVRVWVFYIRKVHLVCSSRGLNNVIFIGIFQYVIKLRVLLSMPQMHVICQRFI